jgi:nicotinic acid mononucleotide adenylyltransferase
MDNRLGILSTAANPLHKGHLDMVHWYEENVSKSVVIEISCSNADKGTLEDNEIIRRANQLKSIGRNHICSTSPTFIQKLSDMDTYKTVYARINSLLTCAINLKLDFLVGFDTYARLINDKYYFYSVKERDRCLKIFEDNNVQFYVFPRLIDNVYFSLDTGPQISSIFIPVTNYEPINISSTKLREPIC